MNVTVEVRGLKGIEDALAQAGPRIAKRALRKALKAGSDVLVREAKELAPILKEPDPRRKPGDLRDSIGAVIKLSPSQQSGTAHVGPLIDSKADSDSPGVYGLFEEFGTIDSAADPYLRPAFDAAAEAAKDAFAEEIIAGVESLKS